MGIGARLVPLPGTACCRADRCGSSCGSCGCLDGGAVPRRRPATPRVPERLGDQPPHPAPIEPIGSPRRASRRSASEAEELIGARGKVRSPLAPVGHVFVKGALWRARSDQEGLDVGDEVVVEGVDGLTLTVAPSPERPEGTAEGVQSAT